MLRRDLIQDPSFLIKRVRIQDRLNPVPKLAMFKGEGRSALANDFIHAVSLMQLSLNILF